VAKKCVGIKKKVEARREESQHEEGRTKGRYGRFHERRFGEKERSGSTIRRRG